MPSFPVKGDQHCESGLVPSSSRPTEDVESSRRRTDGCVKAPWARSNNIRRGIDMPFKRQESPSTVRSSTSTAIVRLPTMPLDAQGRNTTCSRFIEKIRESHIITRSETPIQNGFHLTSRGDAFPSKVDDHNLPIPLPRLSEWIRADAVKGINVHTMPRSP